MTAVVLGQCRPSREVNRITVMRRYILSDADFDRLLLMIDRDPKHGYEGGSSQAQVRDREEDRAFDEAHRFYNYQIRKWLGEVKGNGTAATSTVRTSRRR